MSENRLPEPSEPTRRISEPPVVKYFHPREHAILAEYFELQSKLPKDCSDIDPFEIVPHEEEYNEAENGIVCRPGRGGRSENETLSNAVARIALAPIRSKLPIWGTVKEGEVIHSRQQDHAGDLPQRGYRSDPVLVVSITGRIPARDTVGRFIIIFPGFRFMTVMWSQHPMTATISRDILMWLLVYWKKVRRWKLI